MEYVDGDTSGTSADLHSYVDRHGRTLRARTDVLNILFGVDRDLSFCYENLFAKREAVAGFLRSRGVSGSTILSEVFERDFRDDGEMAIFPSVIGAFVLVESLGENLEEPGDMVPVKYRSTKVKLRWLKSTAAARLLFLGSLSLIERCAFVAFSVGVPYEALESFAWLFKEKFSHCCLPCQLYFMHAKGLRSHLYVKHNTREENML